MKLKKTAALLLLIMFTISCISTKSTLKNVDANAPIPKLTRDNTFVLTEFSKDAKYGYDKDYPINVFYRNTNDEEINQKRFLNALAGPNGETITYKNKGICCPFPSKNINTGGGFLDIYEITYEGLQSPIILYLNRYEKGSLLVPMGLGLKK
jgi:hypothetical protein